MEEELEDDFNPIEKLQALGIAAGGRPLLGVGVQLLTAMTHQASGSSRQLQVAEGSAKCLAERRSVPTAPPAADIKKAKEGGFHTCESLLMNTKKVRGRGGAAERAGSRLHARLEAGLAGSVRGAFYA